MSEILSLRAIVEMLQVMVRSGAVPAYQALGSVALGLGYRSLHVNPGNEVSVEDPAVGLTGKGETVRTPARHEYRPPIEDAGETETMLQLQAECYAGTLTASDALTLIKLQKRIARAHERAGGAA